jgi:hypothetical protein
MVRENARVGRRHVTVTGVDGSAINYEMSPALSKVQLA